MADEWTKTLKEYLIDTKQAAYAGLANVGDCSLYAAAGMTEAWGYMYAEDHAQELEQDDGSKKSETINEPWGIKHYVDNDMSVPSPYQGIWLGGFQYKVTKRDTDFQVGEGNQAYHIVAPLKGSKKQGVQIVATEKTVFFAMWDEDQGITSGKLTADLEKFVGWAITEGGL